MYLLIGMYVCIGVNAFHHAVVVIKQGYILISTDKEVSEGLLDLSAVRSINNGDHHSVIT